MGLNKLFYKYTNTWLSYIWTHYVSGILRMVVVLIFFIRFDSAELFQIFDSNDAQACLREICWRPELHSHSIYCHLCTLGAKKHGPCSTPVDAPPLRSKRITRSFRVRETATSLNSHLKTKWVFLDLCVHGDVVQSALRLCQPFPGIRTTGWFPTVQRRRQREHQARSGFAIWQLSRRFNAVWTCLVSTSGVQTTPTAFRI